MNDSVRDGEECEWMNIESVILKMSHTNNNVIPLIFKANKFP